MILISLKRGRNLSYEGILALKGLEEPRFGRHPLLTNF